MIKEENCSAVLSMWNSAFLYMESSTPGANISRCSGKLHRCVDVYLCACKAGGEGKDANDKSGKLKRSKKCPLLWCLLGVSNVEMKLSITFPTTGGQKLTQVDAEHTLGAFYEKHRATHTSAKYQVKSGRVMSSKLVEMTNKVFPRSKVS